MYFPSADLFPRLPIIPEIILRRHKVCEASDTRFRAAARLLQALWREDQHLPMGAHVSHSGQKRRLGSRLAPAAGAEGRNLLTPEIAYLTRRELAYREVGAMIDEDRVWTNLLSSMPLAFNLFGLLSLDLRFATAVLRRLSEDLIDINVQAIWFEHSPGRGDASLTGDYSAFDVFVIYTRPNGRRGFIAVEMKYAEACYEPVRPVKPNYKELAASSGLYIAPDGPSLRANPLQQLFREHLLAYALQRRGDYNEGRFIVIAPALNDAVTHAVRFYRSQLAPVASPAVPFGFHLLEDMVEAIGQAGAPEYAQALFTRYLDWRRVDRVLERIAANDNGPRDVGPAENVSDAISAH